MTMLAEIAVRNERVIDILRVQSTHNNSLSLNKAGRGLRRRRAEYLVAFPSRWMTVLTAK